MNSKLNKVELNELSLVILGSDTKCKTSECKEIKEKTYGAKNVSKETICKEVSVFYVRILNIIAAILSAVDNENNMCGRKLKALYSATDANSGTVSVCNDDPKLYPTRFLNIEGMEELLRLYKKSGMDGKNDEAKKSELDTLRNQLNSLFKGSASEIDNRIESNNEVLSSKIQSNV